MTRTVTLATGYEPDQTVDLVLEQFTLGRFTIDAVQLTRDNLDAVFEWADSKPFHGPDGVTGLTIFDPAGRNKAEFGDWVYQTPGGNFKTKIDSEFREAFRPAETSS